MTFFRPAVDALPPYVPGKKSDDPRVIKLASNELPFPTMPAVQAAIEGRVSSLNRYPDMAGTGLVADIAETVGVSPDQVVVSNGSVAMIEKVLTAVCSDGAEVVLPWRSFEAYPIAIQIAGGRAVTVPLRPDGGHDIEALIAATGPDTAALMLCSPNNPTGVALTHAEVERVLSAVPDTVPVLLDEAYIEFVEMDDAVRSVELLANHENLIVLRTFSKAYGLAGLRVGYALASPRLAAGLRAVATPFGVNELAQVAAAAALRCLPEVRDRVEAIKAERTRVTEALASLGYDIPTTQANFVWFETEDTDSLVAAAERHLITVRPFKGEGVRVTIAETEGNDRLLALAGELSESHQ